MSEGNGNADGVELIRRKDLVDELVLTWDRATCELKVGGKVVNLEAAMAIVEQARRFFETQLRLQSVVQVQQARAEQERVAAILDRTRGGRGV